MNFLTGRIVLISLFLLYFLFLYLGAIDWCIYKKQIAVYHMKLLVLNIGCQMLQNISDLNKHVERKLNKETKDLS